MELQQVEDFYSKQVEMRLKLFVQGNKRVEKAWETLSTNINEPPKNILEVGCSVGAICWRMGLLWPNAKVTGLDLTKDYIEVGNRLFGSPKLKLIHGTLPYSFSTKFDLVVLMDVYEHIAAEDRDAFNQALKENLAPDGLVFLSFPTVRFHNYVRKHQPEELQPVEENISLEVLSDLAKLLELDVCLYKEVDVYCPGDYAHTILRKHNGFELIVTPKQHRSFIQRVINRINSWRRPAWMKKSYRKNLVESRLHIDR